MHGRNSFLFKVLLTLSLLFVCALCRAIQAQVPASSWLAMPWPC